jgi:hypothetical protein
VYFFAIEITRRRFASIISRLARRAFASPVDIWRAISFRSLIGMPTSFCRVMRASCCSITAGLKRSSALA